MRKTVLEAGEKCGLAAFISRRGPKVHVIAPPDVLAELRERNPGSKWTSSTTPEAMAMGARKYFVYDPDDEGAVIAEVRQRKPGADVCGFLHHVIPALSCDRTIPDTSVAPTEPLPSLRFAVVCTPRSGSTFLCEMLEAAGLGKPEEHLKPPLVHVLSSEEVDHEVVYELIMRQGAKNGIFGTKIISNYLFTVAGPEGTAERMRCLADRGFKFIRLRRDEVGQTVSKFVSGRSGVWHERGEVSAKAADRMSDVDYDFDWLRDIYLKAQREGVALDDAMRQLPPELVLELDYEAMSAEPLKAVEACGRFLGVPAKIEALNFAELPTKLSSAVDHVQQLRQRFEADLKAFEAAAVGISV
jgi:LPS sulfotransferase NodH